MSNHEYSRLWILNDGKFFDSSWEYQRELADLDLKKERPVIHVKRQPGRFDFSGGWSDTPPIDWIMQEEGSFPAVLNVALCEPSLEVWVKSSKSFIYTFNGAWVWNGFSVQETKLLKPIKAIDKFLKWTKPPIEIFVHSNIPPGSGLGGSSILIAAVLKGIFAYYLGKEEVCQMVKDWRLVNYTLAIEQIMGSGGGWQDQVGSLYPGLKLITDSGPNGDPYEIEKIPDCIARGLQQRCLLINTGVTRSAFNMLGIIRDDFVKHNGATLKVIKEIAANACYGADLLLDARYGDFAELVSESWAQVCQILPSSRIPIVDKIEKIIGSDLAGGKLGGAGGGGYYMAILRDADPARRKTVKRRLEKELSIKVAEPRFDL